MKLLAKNAHYTIQSEFETVFLLHPAGQTVIGDFYGDPTAAIIDRRERWCALAGCGLILYYLKEPFEPYEYNCSTRQWVEFHRTPPDEWWIESVRQEGENMVQFVVDPGSKEAGAYLLDTEKLRIQKID